MKTVDTHKDTTDVRQATPQKTNFRVLIISMIVIVVGFGALFMAYSLAGH